MITRIGTKEKLVNWIRSTQGITHTQYTKLPVPIKLKIMGQYFGRRIHGQADPGQGEAEATA